MTGAERRSPSLGNDETSSPEPNSPQHSSRGVTSFGKRTKSKFKRALRIDETKDRLRDSRDSVLSKIENDAGFNLSETLDAKSSTIGQIKEHLPSSAHELAHIIRHPQAVATERTSQQLATSKEPYLSRDDDELLVGAHVKLQQAEDAHDSSPEQGERIDGLQAVVDDIEWGRERKRAAWTSSRYIQRARVIGPRQRKFPVLSSCRWVDTHGESQGYQWSQWFDHMQGLVHNLWAEPIVDDRDEEPIWSRGLMLQQAERIVVASSPWQECISRLRRVSRWENTKLTATWFIIWLAVLYCNRVFTFIYCYVGYCIVYHQRGPERRVALKLSHDRAGEEGATTHTLGEIISRHGTANWLDPVLESVGPAIQPRLTALADWMEVLENFYEWKTPRNTAAMLFVPIASIAFATFFSVDFCMRVAELVAVLVFFLHQPLENRYSKYTRVLMPLHWVLWGIPTHSETSFRLMRTQAELIREGACGQTPDLQEKTQTSTPAPNADGPIPSSTTKSRGRKDSAIVNYAEAAARPDIFATQCRWQNTTGNIVLSFDDMRFVRSFPRKEMWRRPLHELTEIVKGHGETSIIKETQDHNHLALWFADGDTEELEGLKKKDELFNLVIAFSGLTWQHI